MTTPLVVVNAAEAAIAEKNGASSSSDASGVGSEFVVKYVRVWK